MQVAVHAFDPEAGPGDRIAVSAACNEEDVMARGRHARAEIPADRSRCHCCNPHDESSTSQNKCGNPGRNTACVRMSGYLTSPAERTSAQKNLPGARAGQMRLRDVGR